MTDGTDWIVGGEQGLRVRVSPPPDFVVLEDHWIPRVLEMAGGGDGDPEVYARVEVSDSGPKLVELRFTSIDPDARGVRQSDLRAVQVSALVEDFVAGFTFRVEYGPEDIKVRLPYVGTPYHSEALRLVGRMAGARTARDITPQLLERVAGVYRANISGHPTKAVQHHFQVSQRMAAEYVSRARKRGLLPPTKKGKKQA